VSRPTVAVWLLIAATLFFAAGRFFVPGHAPSWPGTYEAAAHIWVGALIGAWVADRDVRSSRWCLVLAVLLTAVETVAFLTRSGRV
jgi:uncharacterized membrane protein YfcA